ncbi:pyrimidine reductase family protein [Saccharopolyspora hirsuta]|uniref:Pyrimidine reductase family protein n=1 Tax=Saccharopolyspora hirsuta TaxID=1837 RepID=A0A5M7BJ89_SACHI|nr:pyrimidine reductase family protein [Saccharopolyspora hirsuta]KAA5830026.1 pyrimidine reductase family protein [Saccharopolyspora hirsuta]
MVDELWPVDGARQVDDELERFYAYPEQLERPWVRVNFVSSLDGAVTVGGRSRGLSAPVDQRVLGLIRDLSDVVLAGVGTAVVEGYRGIKRTEVRAERRKRHGLSEVPPIALVTARASLPPDSPLLTDTVVPPIVLTTEAAPAQRRAELADAGADVVVTGDAEVDLRVALDALAERGLRRIGCEGGPRLFGSLVDQDLVDELCLTLSPLLASGDAGRIAAGAGAEPPRAMRLESVLHAESLLLLRYARMRE